MKYSLTDIISIHILATSKMRIILSKLWWRDFRTEMAMKLIKIWEKLGKQPLIETPEGTDRLRIGTALIYEGMNGEIVIDSE